MFLCCMLISLGLFTYPAHAEESKDHKFEDIKVAYLVNFMRLTVWPDLNQENPDKPLQITVISDKDFYQLLDQKTILYRPVQKKLSTNQIDHL